MVTYRVWVHNEKGSDYVRTSRSKKAIVKTAIALARKGRLTDLTVATGRSLLSERALTKPEKKSLREIARKMQLKKKTKKTFSSKIRRKTSKRR